MKRTRYYNKKEALMGNGFRVIGFSSHRVPEGATQGELEKLSLSQYRPALFAGVL